MLNDINFGFFAYAYAENLNEEQSSDKPEPAGFMFFTYEWSDWRNGLFFWMQSCHVREEYRKAGVFAKMHEFLQGYMKEKNCVGIRLNYEKRLQHLWQPITNKLKMTESHYYIYDINVSAK